MFDRIREAVGAGECILDLGCGSGVMLEAVGGRFNKCVGLDISKARLLKAGRENQNNWEFREADLNADFPVVSDSVDVVIANQVIEHIIDPMQFAKEVYRVLKPGGRCVITTPNIRYIRHFSSLLFSGNGPRTAGGNTLDGAWDDGHLHYFTHRDLRTIFSLSGFVRVESRGLINLCQGGSVRRWLDIRAKTFLVREFFSGNILLVAHR